MPRKKADPASKPVAAAGTPAKTTTATPATVKTAPDATHPHATLFSVRELSRLGTLSDEIVSLRARSAELIERAENAAVALFKLATFDKPSAAPVVGSVVLAEVDEMTDPGAASASYPWKVRAFAARHRAKVKLATAQAEFETLRELAGATTLADKLAAASNAGRNPVEAIGDALGLSTGETPQTPPPVENGNPHNLPIADALPAGNEDDCPE